METKKEVSCDEERVTYMLKVRWSVLRCSSLTIAFSARFISGANTNAGYIAYILFICLRTCYWIFNSFPLVSGSVFIPVLNCFCYYNFLLHLLFSPLLLLLLLRGTLLIPYEFQEILICLSERVSLYGLIRIIVFLNKLN